MDSKILVLNGPNLNLLGTRQPELYGRTTLADIEAACARRGRTLGVDVEFRQSNDEGQLVEWIQQARGAYAALIINAAAYTHSSVAILDALLALDAPIIEVHLSNIHQREEFRHTSFISRAANGIICGLGALGYELAIEAAVGLVDALRRS